MPIVKIEHSENRPTQRETPTDTAVIIVPMTLDRVGSEVPEDEAPTSVRSLAEAFAAFKPSIAFTTNVEGMGEEVRVELAFRSLADFAPRKIVSQAPGQRNDLADLQAEAEVLLRLYERFELGLLKQAWETPAHRAEIIESIRELERSLRAVADGRVTRGPSGEPPPAESGGARPSVREIIARRNAAKAVEDVLSAFHPAPPRTPLGEIFSPEAARSFSAHVGKSLALVAQEGSHEQLLERLRTASERAERVRDRVLRKLFDRLRPLEASYRLVELFFENAEVRDGRSRIPVEVPILNGDTRSMRDPVESTTLVSLQDFVECRNDTFNFRMFISHLVVPGYVPDGVRAALEELARRWGMILLGDLRDEPSLRVLSDQIRTDGGAYEFLRRHEPPGATNVVIAGYVKARDQHWFEDGGGETGAGLYLPGSAVFAGCLIHADRTSGGNTVTSLLFGEARSVPLGRIELPGSQIDSVTLGQQVMMLARNESGHLCFAPYASAANDLTRGARFFASYRVVPYIERRIGVYLRRVARERLTRDLVKEQIVRPVEEFLDKEKRQGTLYNYALDVDMDQSKLMQGILDITLSVAPTSNGESYLLKLDPPPFEHAGEA